MCWNAEYALLLAATTMISYVTGLRIGAVSRQEDRNKYLIISLVISVVFLSAFKYFNFLNGSLKSITNYFNLSYGIPELDILLPVGLSFYIFKSISYSIDVYRGKKGPEKNLINYALYVSFFPQLLAGPIERATHLLPQFNKKHTFDYNRVTDGLRLIAWGLFKKVVIADRLAVAVDRIYDNPYQYQGFPLIAATILFTYQIYCDFSGYSDIAIGTARIMGFDSKTNFNRPYFSSSVSEFWKRWHISLTSWFRDYLYIPLGGNRVMKLRWNINLMIVFLISGLWHGANWTFVAWGALHGFYLLFSIWTKKTRDLITRSIAITRIPFLHHSLKVATTFTLVTFAWLFFRANNLKDAVYIITHMFVDTGYFLANITDPILMCNIIGQLGISRQEGVLVLVSIFILEAVQLLQGLSDIENRFAAQPIWLRWSAYYVLSIMIIYFGAFNLAQDFIYLQF